MDKLLDPFDKAPFLVPWYFSEQKPELVLDHSTLTWKFIDKVEDEYLGVLTLNNNDNVIGLFKTYVYIHPSPDKKSFCVWSRSNDSELNVPSLKIDLFFTKDLESFAEKEKTLLEFHKNKTKQFLLNSKLKTTVSFQLNSYQENFTVDFPIDFKVFDEFIAVADIPGLYPDANSGWNNTALIVINPQKKLVSIYPQDWFNKDKNADFGYQWITRAVRKESDGRIIIQGIRIDSFELDKTNRQIEEKFN